MKNSVIRSDVFELLSSVSAGSVDMILTDPPYGSTVCDWDVHVDFARLMEEFRRVLRRGGNCLVMGTNPFMAKLITANASWFKHDLVWDKVIPNGAWYSRYRPMGRHELIAVFGVGKCYYEPLMEERDRPIYCGGGGWASNIVSGFVPVRKDVYTHRHPTTILSVVKKKGVKGLHPSHKPIELMERLIRMYCPVGGLVLDPFCGSGSVGAACVRSGRDYLLGDIDEGFVEYSRRVCDEA